MHQREVQRRGGERDAVLRADGLQRFDALDDVVRGGGVVELGAVLRCLLQNTAFCTQLSYICPEPVLVTWIVSIPSNGSKTEARFPLRTEPPTRIPPLKGAKITAPMS